MNLTKEEALRKIKELQEYIENNDKVSVENITYTSACEILKETKLEKFHFLISYQWYEHQLATIIRAINYLDNNKIWKCDFTNSEYKYRNLFIISGDFWLFHSHEDHISSSSAPAWLHFKNKESALKAVKNKTIFNLYCKVLG